VSEIIQGTGHNTSSTSFTANRITIPTQKNNQFYASSAPSSSPALFGQQQNSTQRPQVPLFHSNSTGNVNTQHQYQSNNMSIADMPSGTLAQSQAYDHQLTLNTEMTSDFDFLAGGYDDSVVPHDGLYSNYSSPAFPSVHDPNMPLTTAPGTVSPKDLMRDPIPSAPNSTSFTNLTSPSIFDSPSLDDSYETSPMFNAEADFGHADNWFPLFGNTSAGTFAGGSASADDSPPIKSVELDHANDASPSGMSRKKSSPGHSPPQGGHQRHSSVSGVSSRRRDKPLAPIMVDPNDSVAYKRARNTLAARKSRQKKMERFDELEKKIEDLEGEVEHWKSLALHNGAAANGGS
jgi:general control protein GCN4